MSGEQAIFNLEIKKKSGLRKKLKVSTLDIRMKQSGLKVSHSKFPRALGWWISRSMLDLLFFLISRFNNACSPFIIYY